MTSSEQVEPLAPLVAEPDSTRPLCYLIDVFSLMFQVFHGIPPMTSPTGQPTNALFGFSRDMLSLLRDLPPGMVFCAFDSPGPGIREEWYPAYKANRAEMPPDLAPQIPQLKEVLQAFGLTLLQHEGWEADDIIATLTRRAVAEGCDVAIVTSDKDARQLLGPHVRLYNFRKASWFDERSLLEDWGIRPDQVIDFQALVGDAVDNVPGVPLIGPKKAAQLLNQLGTLEDVLARADEAPGAKLRENLKQHADLARLSRRLVELRTDLPLELEWERVRQPQPDVPALQQLFRQYGFRRLVDEIRIFESGSAGNRSLGFDAGPASLSTAGHSGHATSSAIVATPPVNAHSPASLARRLTNPEPFSEQSGTDTFVTSPEPTFQIGDMSIVFEFVDEPTALRIAETLEARRKPADPPRSRPKSAAPSPLQRGLFADSELDAATSAKASPDRVTTEIDDAQRVQPGIGQDPAIAFVHGSAHEDTGNDASGGSAAEATSVADTGSEPFAAAQGTLSSGVDPLTAGWTKRRWTVVRTRTQMDDFVRQLSQQSRYCLDLETTGLDPLRAQIVGWAFCWEPGVGWYLPVQGPPGEEVLPADDVAQRLRPVLESPDRELVNQNVKYDLIVLAQVGIRPPRIGLDPMVGDYLLDAGARSHNLETLAEKYLQLKTIPISDLIGTGRQQRSLVEVPVERVAEYATEDAELVVRLHQLLKPALQHEGLWDLYWDLERPLIPVLARMQQRGIRVDVLELNRQSAECELQLQALMQEIHQLAGHEFNIDSPIQLRKVLFEEQGLPVLRKTKTGPSTDQEVLEELATRHPLPAKIIEHRHLSKLKGTYLDTLPELVNPTTGRIHCSFNQVVASTGRLSASDPNLQNIPIRTAAGRQIRKAFVPERSDWQLVCADYSQIELRMLAHFSGDPVLLAAFQQRIDIHTAVAAAVHHVSPADVNPEMRRIAKAVNFGVLYGQSAFGLAAVLGIPQDDAAAFIDEYFAKYSGVTHFLEQLLDEAQATGYARTILGRRRAIEGIRPAGSRNRNRNLSERTAINTVIQGSAADLIKQAMLRVEQRLAEADHPGRLLLQIHDELVFESPLAAVPELVGIIRDAMEGALEVAVPLEVDVSAGPNWLETASLP